MKKHMDDLEKGIAAASEELLKEPLASAHNLELQAVWENKGRQAFAMGMPNIPPVEAVGIARRDWVRGWVKANDAYKAEQEQPKKPKRTRPAARVERAERINTVLKGEFTGGSVDYYQLQIDHPTTPKRKPYTVECNDIIEALEMNFAEGNVFKALWRSAAARKGKMKRGHDALYDAEKIVFFGQRQLEQVKLNLKR